VRDWRDLMTSISASHPAVVGIAPFINGEGMLTSAGRVRGTLIRGVLPSAEPQVSIVADKMRIGSLDDLKPGAFNIILGNELARALGALPGDKITLVTPQALSTPAGILPRLKRFTISGIFEIGMNEYDSSLALIHIDDAALLMRMDDTVSGLRIKLVDMFKADAVGRELASGLPPDYWFSDWTRQHANLFRAVKIEKRMMFIILSLIVAVAAFNIISTLVMVVTDKQSDIAILRTLGMSPRSVLTIFIIQGTVIGLIGTLLGGLCGVLLALNVDTVVAGLEQLLGMEFMPADVYYISDFPSELHWDDVFQITGISFLLTLFATLYPAWRAARTQPAEALRYE
jgi:lipoprotein-releasing system permease protein